MKENILKLRSEGKSYKEIKKILGCSTSTISYHCGEDQKEKNLIRGRNRKKNILKRKIDNFRCKVKKVKVNNKNSEVKTKEERYARESVRKFQKRDNDTKGAINKDISTTFTWEDVLSKFGENTYCYLSGEKINLFENNYNLDHIIPASKDGKNTLDNLGITHKIVNTMKSDLLPDELIEWCKKILEFNGYKVEK